MQETDRDITRTIISKNEALQHISSIFTDSVILDNQFNFVFISQNILQSTGYKRAELYGRSISVFSNSYNIQELIEGKLRAGYFDESHLKIATKNSGMITYGISGFYLGMITEINELIVLKFKNLDEINLLYNKLEAKTTELDNFVYLSAHSLRGPLATMKGLINLSRCCEDPAEMKFILQQLDTFAEKLDVKLHHLIHFAEADKGYETSTQDASLQAIVTSLTNHVKEVTIDQPVSFRCETTDQSLVFGNIPDIFSLLTNLVLFFCHRPKANDNQLVLNVHSNHESVEIILRAKGFILNELIRDRLKNGNLGYSEILNYPEMINFYAAKKIIYKLNGDIEFILTPNQEVVVLMNLTGINKPCCID